MTTGERNWLAPARRGPSRFPGARRPSRRSGFSRKQKVWKEMENKASEGEYRPRVSAIIPNWNRSIDLREALLAIKAQTYPVSEIIVVDNNSSDDSVAILRGDFPEVMTICSPHNIFINSLNIAAKTASGDLILHQDNDGILAADRPE